MRQCVRLFCIVAILLALVALPLFSQNEVPFVTAVDDSFPSLGSVYLDPSNHPVEFSGGGFFDIFTEFSLDITPGGGRIWPQPGFSSFSGKSTVRSGSGLHKDIPLDISVQFGPGSGSGGVTTFDTEMLSLSITGTTVMLRESPTRASTGKTTLRESPTRPRLSSFFDVFFELSTDGGGTWIPADDSVRLEMKIKPTILINRPDPPPMNAGRYIGDIDRDGLPDIIVTLPVESPLLAVDTTATYNLQSGFIYSVQPSTPLIANPGTVIVHVHHTFDDGGTQFFDTEMLSMDISGGALPAGVMVRESPTKASLGRTSIRTMPGGQAEVSSFFDIFTELSVDGGQTWTPQPPASLDFMEPLISQVPTVSAPDNRFPVPGSVMLDPSNSPVSFNGFFDVFTELTLDFAGTTPVKPPLPGASQNQSMSGIARFHFSLDGGTTVQVHTCPADALLSMASSSSSGDTRMFDTEMLSLSLSGGSLPSGVLIRESPTKQSLGQHTIRESPSRPTRIGSFFDIFTELSVDGGQTWLPADGTLRLETKILRAPSPSPEASVLPSGKIENPFSGDPDFDLLRITHNTQPPPPPPPVGSSSTFALSGASAVVFHGGLGEGASDVVALCRATGTFSDGTTQLFDTEMLQLDIKGGTLPGGVMVRESPSKASLGRSSVHTLPGGEFEVSSFFDIFTELSIDGGQTWTPQAPTTMEFVDSVRESPTLSTCLPIATYPDDLFPFPGAIVHPPGVPPETYLNGARFRYHEWRWVSASGSRALPPLGVTDFYNDDLITDMQISPPGMPFQDVVASGPVLVQITHSTDDGTTRHFDTEMLSLNLTSTLGVMIRESPTLQSLGHTIVKPNGSGYSIDSFFDIFTEISLDGGASWIPSNGPTHLVQELSAPELPFVSTNFPPAGAFKVNQTAPEQCDNGVVFENGARAFRPAFFDIFTEAALPPPGGSSTNDATGHGHMEVSLDGGNSFFDVFFEVPMSTRVTSTNNTATTRFFDTEMLALNISGGSLPPRVMIRESPTKQSLGKVTLRESPTRIGSFFDIFVDLSVDGGQTWSPALNSMRIELDTVKSGTITGMKWHDADGNGILDGGETGIANWLIVLSDTLGNIIDTVRTDGSGNYSFSDVPAGTYRVSEESQPGWIQTGGAPAYGFWMVPGDTNKGNDFGNFQAPSLTGVKFNDHNSDGIRDPEDEGVRDWEICLFPKSIASPNIQMSSGTGMFSMRLNGLPPGTPITAPCGILAGVAIPKFIDITKAAQSAAERADIGAIRAGFENGGVPTELLSLELRAVATFSDGTTNDVTLRSKRCPDCPPGHITLMKREPASGSENPSYSSFFDVFLECITSPRDAASGLATGRRMHGTVHFEAHGIDGALPLLEGTRYVSSGGVLLDENEQPAGTLDSLEWVVGPPASQVNPICVKTDSAGMYSFSPLPPGVWNIFEGQQPCWVATTGPVPPILSTSGVPIPPVDFGNHENKGTICVTKYYDINHNQQLDGGEPPMEGVWFTLTGPTGGSSTGVTDVDGYLCFSDLDPGEYSLTETVPAGYALSFPKSGVINATIAECETLSYNWLNSAALTDTLFRTATAEDWARAVDKKNKHKEEKCKPDKVDFKFNVRMLTPGVSNAGDFLEVKFNMPVDSLVVYTDKTKITPCPTLITTSDPKKQVWQISMAGCVAIGSDSVVQIDGRGFKGSLIKFSYRWINIAGPSGSVIEYAKGALPGKPIFPQDVIKKNQLILPMPNLNNVGEQIYDQGGFPIIVGAPLDSHSVIHKKYTDVQKSLYKDSKGILTLHTDTTRCLDRFITNQKTLLKQQKTLPPAKHNNAFFAEVLALKMNLLASRLGKFPVGLDSLIYDDHKNLQNPTHPVFDGKHVVEIMNQADIMLACKVDPKGALLTPLDYYRVIKKINGAFSGPVDTTRWSCVKLELKGVRPLKSVSYLRAEPGQTMIPETFPVNPNAREFAPSAFSLNQNYPNPFNPTTTIQFELLEEAIVTMKIYNMLGQEVATLINNEVLDEGETEVEFDASSLPSGVYLYKLVANGIGDVEEGIAGQTFVSVKKMLLLK